MFHKIKTGHEVATSEVDSVLSNSFVAQVNNTKLQKNLTVFQHPLSLNKSDSQTTSYLINAD